MGFREANGVPLVHMPVDSGQFPEQDAQDCGWQEGRDLTASFFDTSRKLVILLDKITRLEKVWL